MIARLGWLALGVAVGVLGGRVAARRSEPAQAPPVLAAATRVELAAPSPVPTPVAPEPAAPEPTAPEPAAPDPTAPAPAAPEPAPPVADTPPARPSPSPRPRPEPSGRHAWVPPEDDHPA